MDIPICIVALLLVKTTRNLNGKLVKIDCLFPIDITIKKFAVPILKGPLIILLANYLGQYKAGVKA